MTTLFQKFSVTKIAVVMLMAAAFLMAPQALAAKKNPAPKDNHQSAKKDVVSKVEKILLPLVTTAAADNTSPSDKSQKQTTPSDPPAIDQSKQANSSANQTTADPAQTPTDPAQSVPQTDPASNQTSSTDNQTQLTSISMPADVTPTDTSQQTAPPPADPQPIQQTKKPAPTPSKQLAFNFTLPKAVNETNNAVAAQALAAVPVGVHNLPLLSEWEPFMAQSPYGFTPLSKQLTAVLNTAALALLLLGLALVVNKRQQLSAETEDEAVRKISISLS